MLILLAYYKDENTTLRCFPLDMIKEIFNHLDVDDQSFKLCDLHYKLY